MIGTGLNTAGVKKRMNEIVASAKAQFLNSKTRLLAAYHALPVEKRSWSPSPTARSADEILGHCAMAVTNIQNALDGTRFPIETSAEADADFRAWEANLGSSEEVVKLFEDRAANYEKWLEEKAESRLNETFPSPFGLPEMPNSAAISFQSLHIESHIPQIEYIQTILGDRVWR